MLHVQSIPPGGDNRLRGRIDPAREAADGRVHLVLESGEEVVVAADALRPQPDGSYLVVLDGAREAPGEEVVIPVVEETVRIGKRAVETGRVRVVTTVHEREEQVDVPVVRESIEVERVPVGRFVDGPVAVRTEGDLTIIPVLEEVLVVEKKLLLKEEVHVRRHRQEHHEPQRVTLRSEQVEVEREQPPAVGGTAFASGRSEREPGP